MNDFTVRSIFIILIMKIGQSDLVSLNDDSSLDPYQDWYLRTVFSMDKNAVMRIPKLDDKTFLKQLDEGVIDTRGLVLRSNTPPMSDKKLDEELVSQSAMEETWEELIVAGPITVNYIGNLMVLSSKKDFPLPLPTPDSAYEYIKYPNSFRTTLVQISNEMYNAFMGAHENMYRIQLDMQQIPKHLKTVIQLLTSASNRLIQSMLPTALGSIERIAKQCAEAANSTVNRFQMVTGLLQEVTEVTIYAYGHNTDQLKNVSNLVNNSIATQTFLTSQLEEIRQRYEEAKRDLDKAREEYYKAYHDIPVRLRGPVGKFIGGFINGIVGAIGCIFSSCNSKPHPPVDNTAFENAKKRAELALENLKKAEVKYDEWYAKMLEQQNQLAATIIQLSQLDMQQVNYQTTIDILVRATNEIAELGKQWSNMTEFFTSLSARADATQKTILYQFIESIQNVMLIDGVLDEADREFFVLNMLDIADDIERGAHLLYIMAKTYYDVSNQYIIGQIAGLSALAVIQTDGERQIRMQQLANDTLSTSAKVSRMAQDRKQQYDLRNQARQDEYNMYILQIMSEELEGSIGK